MTRRKRFGDAAVSLGFASRQEVTDALSEQETRLKHDGDRVLIGFLMVETGALTAHQLLEVLNHTSENGRLISEDAILLATRLESSLEDDQRVIMMSSVNGEENSSIIATQLAIAFALMDRGQILLIDADFRVSSQHARLGLNPAPGLTEYLEKDLDLGSVLQETGVPRLSFLSGGSEPKDVLSVFLSENYAPLIHDLRTRFHRIIIDSSSIGTHSDAAVIASYSDGVVLAMAEDQHSREEVREILRILDGLNVTVIGSVLTHA